MPQHEQQVNSTTLPDGAVILTANPAAPELLAPAGDWEALRAAVANGADAVYFGLTGFNARHRAANFTLDDLPQVISYLHAHNVRGYVAFNVLIFSDELDSAAQFISEIAAAGADAMIVQDLGLAALIHRMCPTLPIHGSTQMTLTEPLGIEFVRQLGVERVILARELSTDDIRRITAAASLPVEVFVHGALCVSYSGQCLTSESLGGRSANRGQCAQACRLPYDLIVDGAARDLGDRAYLLSPQDLAAHDLIGELAKLGVVSVKIEGRLKSAQYVAATTQTYRAAIDATANSRPFIATPQQKADLAQSFSRGFTHGFLDGVDHQTLVHARFPKSRGIAAGQVVGKTAAGLIIRQPASVRLKAGDGVVFDQGHPEQDEQGGRIVAVNPDLRRKDIVEIAFRRGDVSLEAVEEGCAVWKTDDPEIRRRLEHSYSRDQVVRRVPISVRVTADIGRPLIIRAIDDGNRQVQVQWDRPLEAARKFPMTPEIFREQFGRLGDTPFELGEVIVNGLTSGEFPPVMIPKSVLNDLRRQATAQLLQQRETARRYAVADRDALVHLRGEAVEKGREFAPPDEPHLHVMVRTMEQLEAVAAWKPDLAKLRRGMVYCDFEDIRQYPQAVEFAHAAEMEIALATLRIVKPTELGLLRSVAAAKPDAILVRNLAGLSHFKAQMPHIPLIADYSLNITNELTAAIIAQQGAVRMTSGYDLNWKQLVEMIGRFSAACFEVVIHQHMPMFHMEHCVFAHTLSNGKDHRDCGRPCDTHRVDLKDRAGVSHSLIADVGCRNTVYNGTPQSAAEFLPRMMEHGLRHFRVELLRQDRPAAIELLDRYARLLAGTEEPRETWRQLRVLNQLGVTRGTLE